MACFQLGSPGAVALASLLALTAAALLALSLALGAVGWRLGGRVESLRVELEAARKRVADLEQENDYLFEEREMQTKGSAASTVVIVLAEVLVGAFATVVAVFMDAMEVAAVQVVV